MLTDHQGFYLLANVCLIFYFLRLLHGSFGIGIESVYREISVEADVAKCKQQCGESYGYRYQQPKAFAEELLACGVRYAGQYADEYYDLQQMSYGSRVSPFHVCIYSLQLQVKFLKALDAVVAYADNLN